jgi:hypothetical protein
MLNMRLVALTIAMHRSHHLDASPSPSHRSRHRSHETSLRPHEDIRDAAPQAVEV